MADYLATYETAGTGAIMQVEINFAGLRPDVPDQPGPYIDVNDVKAEIVVPATPTSVGVTTPIELEQVNSVTFRTKVVVPIGTILRVYRLTDIEFPIVDFISLQVVTESDLDLEARQVLYAVMESRDLASRAQDRARFATEVSVEANKTAEEAKTLAEAAVVTADGAQAAAANAVQVANAADERSTQALEAAEAAEEHATQVEVLAAQAQQSAEDAAASAAQAASDAAHAVDVATSIDSKAQAALDAAQRADANASQALSTANGIAGTANQAAADALQAVQTANAAKATAEAVDAKAQSALDASNAAVGVANTANSTANAAKSTADTALSATQTNATAIGSVGTRVTALESWKIDVDAGITNIYNNLNAFDLRITKNATDISGLSGALFRKSKPEYVHEACGVGSFFIWRGSLYAFGGTSASQFNTTLGRGLNGTTQQFGAQNIQRVPIFTTSPVVAFATQGANAYALCADGGLWGWGQNAFGQLGLGHQNPVAVPTLLRADVAKLHATPSSNGFDYTTGRMFITDTSGDLWVAGYNGYGACGTNDTANKLSWTKTWSGTYGVAPMGVPIKSMWNLGSQYGAAVVITTDKRMFVCGLNGQGQLGTGNTAQVNSWTDVTAAWGGPDNVDLFTEIHGNLGYATASVGTQGTIIASSRTSVFTCGYGGFGMLGNGGTADRYTPYGIAIANSQVVTAGGAPGQVWVRRSEDNGITCWGHNEQGQLGLGDTLIRTSPVRHTSPLLTNAVNRIMLPGSDRNTYGHCTNMFFRRDARAGDGYEALVSVGVNGYGERGIGVPGALLSPADVRIPLIDTNGAVWSTEKVFMANGSVGDNSGAQGYGAMSANGTVVVWGHNAQQTILAGAQTAVSFPVTVTMPWNKVV